jgi:hypothetical protein
MTITLTKSRLGIAVLAVVMLVPATAWANHVFTDVPDDKFYAAPVEWAFDNGITTGKTPTSFAPDDNVTRGESVTFLKRYNDNIVEPADATLQAGVDAAQADADANAAAIAELETRTNSHFLLSDKDATVINTSYPGATVSRFEGEPEGVYIATFPGLELFNPASIPLAEIFCAAHSTPISDDGTSTIVFQVEDPDNDRSQVAVLTRNSAGAFEDKAFSLTVTC